MSRNFEKLIEYIINSDETRARKLFHEIVVSKSRNIYESFEQMDEAHGEEEMEEGVSDFIDEVEADETADLAMETDMEPESGDMGGDDMEMGDDLDMHDGMDDDHMSDDMGGDEGLEDRVVDLEDAIDELKAEFEKLMADESDSETEDEADSETEDEADEADEDMEEMAESFIREYTEKAPAPVHSEEGSVNKKSTVAKKNDMGGTAKNLVQGGEEKGRTAPSTKPMGYNDPKAAGKVAFKSQAPKPVTKEIAGTNKDSVLESRKTRNKKK